MRLPLFLLAIAPLQSSAQQVRREQLKAGDQVLQASFAPMTQNVELTPSRQIRELTDGRILISDPASNHVLIASFGSARVDTVANVPAGGIIGLAGDTTLIWTMSKGWFFFKGATSIGMLPDGNPVVGSRRSLRGGDSHSLVLSVANIKNMPESTQATLVSRTTAAETPVTKLLRARPLTPGPRSVCSMYERALLTVDGWIAVLRTAPYRVDWRSPDGHWVLGPAVVEQDVAMDDANKQVYLEWRRQEAPAGSAASQGDSIMNWPSMVCPWTGGYPPLVTPDEKLLVYRTPIANIRGTRYDIFNRRGEREAQLVLRENEAILGFGQNSVFLAVRDGGVERIHKRPWP